MPSNPNTNSVSQNASLENDGREAEKRRRRRLTWTLHPASEQVAPGGGGDGDGDAVATGERAKRVGRGGEGLREGSGRRGEEEQQLLRHGWTWSLLLVPGLGVGTRESRIYEREGPLSEKGIVPAVWCRLRISPFKQRLITK
jgi:hypothetical protein